MHASSIEIMRRFAKTIGAQQSVLDVGSRDINGSYKDLFKNSEYVGLDISSGKNVDIAVSDPYDWVELNGRQFDVVISGQCLEHCSKPWLTAQQILKHCKSNGWIAVIAPFMQKKHGYPHDYFRFTDDGLISLFDNKIILNQCGVTQGTKQIFDAWLLGKKIND